MRELWYWKSNDRIRGPLVTEELEAIVLANRLQEGDAVRLDGSEEWLPAIEIRKMFATSSASPAATAAKLLETAAARRMQGAAGRHDSGSAGSVLSTLSDAGASVGGRVLELGERAVHSTSHWLGRRGRLLLTLLAGAAVIGFFVSRVHWGESDAVRLYRLRSLWKQVQKADGTLEATTNPETAAWLQKTQVELESTLKRSPVSGSSGSSRRTAMGRREMLFAVRELRRAPPLEEPDVQRIERSLEAAGGYLAVAAEASSGASNGAATKRRGDSALIIAIIVIDAALLVVGATWWVMRRR